MRAMEGLTFLSEKVNSDIKDHLAFNGKPTRQWVDKEDKAIPTALT